MKHEICVLLVVQDQCHQAIDRIKRLINDRLDNKIVVVDNCSSDEFPDWLMKQSEFDYIICQDETETYGSIVNAVRKEFCDDMDLLVITPALNLTWKDIDKMQEVLYLSEAAGAVTENLVTDKKNNDPRNERIEYTMNLIPDIVMYKADFLNQIGDFDEKFLESRYAIVDYMFRGLMQKYCYICGGDIEAPLEMIQRSVFGIETNASDGNRLRKKWGMNYFNCIPNRALLSFAQGNIDQKIHILEIGCDCGVNLLCLKNRFPQAQLYGVEINESAAKIASAIAEVVVDNIELLNLPFENIKFDYIIFGDVLEHLRNPEEVLRYCKSLLAPQGKVLACIPNLMHYTVMRDLMDGRFRYTDTGLLDKTHIHFFTCSEIVETFQNAGYTISRFEALGARDPVTKEENDFIQALLKLSTETQEFMYRTFQYLVMAE